MSSSSKFGDETKKFFECVLASSLRNEGPNGPNVAKSNGQLGQYYAKLASEVSADRIEEHLRLARSYFKEAVRISSKRHGSAHPQTIDYEYSLSVIAEVL